MFYHASQTHCIEVLEPRVSQHGRPLVYLSKKRENVLVYLSNAIEKHCRETGFPYEPPYRKWASYGFQDGLVALDEYYPNALEDTYKGVSGYIYVVEDLPEEEPLGGIPDAVVTGEPVSVLGCEYVPDAYEAIMEAVDDGLIIIRRYEDVGDEKLRWIERTVKQQYEEAKDIPTYRHFLNGKFPEITSTLG